MQRSYPGIPVCRRRSSVAFATNLSARGVGLGRLLLVDAITRAVRSEIASFALVLDAKDEAAASFYERESFIRLPGTPIRFFRRMDDLAALIAAA